MNFRAIIVFFALFMGLTGCTTTPREVLKQAPDDTVQIAVDRKKLIDCLEEELTLDGQKFQRLSREGSELINIYMTPGLVYKTAEDLFASIEVDEDSISIYRNKAIIQLAGDTLKEKYIVTCNK